MIMEENRERELFDSEEIVFEEDLTEVADLDGDGRPPEDDDLQEGMEDLDIEGGGGLVEPIALRDDSVCCFRGHSGSVFSVSVHPSGGMVCSGGEDDKAVVWSTQDGSIVFQCQGHRDSVTCTGFSDDGKYLATADMGGLVQVWSVSSWQLVCTFECSDIEWLQWHGQAHILLVGTSDGGGWMWKVPSGECKTFQGQSCRNVCGVFLKDGKRACFGYEDGGVRVWDLKDCKPLVNITASGGGHRSPVTCLAAHHDNQVVLSGSEDTTAKLMSTSTGKVLVTFAAGGSPPGGGGGGGGRGGSSVEAEGPQAPVVEAVGFSPSLPLALTGSLSGVLAVWDLPTQKLRQQCVHEAGVVRLRCASSSPVVFSACLDGQARAWDLRSGECVMQWQGHTDQILDMAVARDDSLIATGSDDHTARVFRTIILCS